MTAPFEIVAGQVEAYLAVLGTAFPVINAAPAGAWVKLGAAGAKSTSEDGVTIRASQTVNKIRTLGTTGARKAFRSEEDLEVELTIFDITAEAFAAAMNGLAITTLAGPPAEKTVQLLQGPTVIERAMLIRGVLSPYADSASNLQVDVPRVFQDETLELIFKKDEPVGLKMRFFTLQDDTLGFGKIHLPTA